MKFPSLLLLLLLASCSNQDNSPVSQPLWVELDVLPATPEPLNVHGIIGNDSGTLLTFGYTEEVKDCGLLKLGKCRPFRIYRSRDEGSSWQDVTDPLIAERHSFWKGDKLPIPNKWAARLAKKVWYSDWEPKGRYFANGNLFYMLVDDMLYVSRDEGDTWKHLDLNSIHYNKNDLVELTGDYLVTFNTSNRWKHVYRANGKGYFDTKAEKNFVVMREGSKATLLFADGDNLASDYYYTGESEISSAKPPGETETCQLNETYLAEDGTIYANLRAPGESSRVGVWASRDRGATFQRMALGPLEDLHYDRAEVFGTLRGMLLLRLGVPLLSEDPDKALVFIEKFFLYRNDAQMIPFPFPEGTHGLTNGLKVFYVRNGAIYCGTPLGLFRSKHLAAAFMNAG
jgi:hypothetical protein